jgi:hypothetical protein
MTRALVRAIVTLALAGPLFAQSPPGTATLAGRVVTDEPAPAPLRRVSVMLNPAEGNGVGHTVISEDDGTFRFTGLPAGRYLLSARKPGWLRANFGATRPGRPGTPIAIAGGATRDGIVLPMARGAAVSGIVLDPSGDPASEVYVSVLRIRIVDGARKLEEEEGARTDDRGVYRVFGLAPGDYLVVASPRAHGMHGMLESMRQIGSADVQAALREIESRASGAATPSPPSSLGLAPIYFPGVTQPDQAQPVTLAAGAERAGVDISLQHVPTARVAGAVLMPDGSPAGGVSMYLMPEHSLLAFGPGGLRESHGAKFEFRGVTSGTYTLIARTGVGGHGFGGLHAFSIELPAGAPPPPPVTPPVPMWASTTIAVGPAGMSDVALTLQPAFTISGRLRLDASPSAPMSFENAHVRLHPIAGDRRLAFSSTAEVDRDGTFTMTGVMPGRYLVIAGVGGSAGEPAWAMTSVVAGDRDVTDRAFEIGAAAPSDLVVTLSDRVSSLRGSLVDAANRAAPDFYVIAFPADRSYWLPESRRVQAVRPATDGTFLFRSLPAGEYRLAALTDVEQNEWHDAGFLEKLLPHALAVVVSEGVTTTQNVRIASGPR